MKLADYEWGSGPRVHRHLGLLKELYKETWWMLPVLSVGGVLWALWHILNDLTFEGYMSLSMVMLINLASLGWVLRRARVPYIDTQVSKGLEKEADLVARQTLALVGEEGQLAEQVRADVIAVHAGIISTLVKASKKKGGIEKAREGLEVMKDLQSALKRSVETDNTETELGENIDRMRSTTFGLREAKTL